MSIRASQSDHANGNKNLMVLLAVHEKPRQDDKEAEKLFEQLQRIWSEELALDHNVNFEVRRLNDHDAQDFRRKLPCIRSGEYYEGLEQIRSFLATYLQMASEYRRFNVGVK